MGVLFVLYKLMLLHTLNSYKNNIYTLLGQYYAGVNVPLGPSYSALINAKPVYLRPD